MSNLSVDCFLKNFIGDDLETVGAERICEIVKERFEGSCLDWKILHSKIRYGKELGAISFAKMTSQAKTFKDWSYIYSTTRANTKERKIAFQNLKELGKLEDWLWFLAENLDFKDEITVKKRFLKEINAINFSELDQPESDFTEIPTFMTQKDWISLYEKYSDRVELVDIIGRLLGRTGGDFYDWWRLYDENHYNLELRNLIIQKMMMSRSYEDIHVWKSVYKNLKSKGATETDPLMQAVKSMEYWFNADFYDDTDEDYYVIPTLDSGLMEQDFELDFENYRYNDL